MHTFDIAIFDFRVNHEQLPATNDCQRIVSRVTTVDSGDSLTLGIGAMTDARMKDFFDKMVRAGVVKVGLDYRKSYTTQFVDKKIGLDLRPKP